MRYRSDDPLFARYEEAVTAVVADDRRDALGRVDVLDDDPPGCERVLDRVVEHPVPAARAAGDVLAQRGAMAGHGARTRDALIDAFREPRAADGARDDRDVGAASGGVQEAPRVMPAFFRTSGGTPNSRHAPYVMPLRCGVGLRDLHELLLEAGRCRRRPPACRPARPRDCAAPAAATAAGSRPPPSARVSTAARRFFTLSAVRLRPRFGLFASSASR